MALGTALYLIVAGASALPLGRDGDDDDRRQPTSTITISRFSASQKP